MHKRNNKSEQRSILDWDMLMSNNKLETSIWGHIRTEVFEKVDEDAFSPLYSQKMGRPNTPVNILVTLLTIKEMNDLTFRELESQMDYHIGVQYACGCEAGQQVTTLRTITNFLKSLRNYNYETGIDLFSIEFNRLVRDQIHSLGLSTKIARTDSTYVDTNVCSYNRLQLLIEVVKRVYRILEEEDKQQFALMFRDYVDYEADNYVYNLRSSEIENEFRKIGNCYYTLQQLFGDRYSVEKSWKLYLRVFKEQFRITEEDKIELKPSKEMTSSSVRGVDDPEATLRHKSGENYLGYVGNVVETSDPENAVNLICDADLYQNNTPDERMLVNGFDDLKERKLPGLNELHFDAGYGGKLLDEKLEKHEVKGIQTAIKGVKTDHRMDVIKEDGCYFAICSANEKVSLEKTDKGYKADFTKAKCSVCKSLNKCPVKYLKKLDTFVYYIRNKELSKRLRLTNIKTIPKARKTIRSGVEATVRQFKCRTKAGKTRLRGCFRHKIWFQLTALAINIRRIHQYVTGTPTIGNLLRKSSFSRVFCRFYCFIIAVIDNIWAEIGNTINIFGSNEVFCSKVLKPS